MVDNKVQKQLQRLVVDMQTSQLGNGIGILSLLSKSKNQDAEFALRITKLVEEHGPKVLNTPIDNKRTLLDITQNLKVAFELTNPFAERGTRFPQTAKTIIEKGGKNFNELFPPQKTTDPNFAKDIKRLANELQINASFNSNSNPLTRAIKPVENTISGSIEKKINNFTQKYGAAALNETIPGTEHTLLDVAQNPSALATLGYAKKQMQGMQPSAEVIDLLSEKGAKTSTDLAIETDERKMFTDTVTAANLARIEEAKQRPPQTLAVGSSAQSLSR